MAGVRVLFSWGLDEAKGDRWLRLGDVASHEVIVVRCPWDGGSAKFMEDQSLRELTLPPDDASHAVLFLKIALKSRLAVSTTI